MDKIRRLFGRKEVPIEARDLLASANSPRQLLRGLDELITRNELEVNAINYEIESLETVEQSEIERVRSGELADRSKNNVLRRVGRLRKQMDNLEERQQIYNRNINLQIHLVGRVQALDAMEMRGVDESVIDNIVNSYEDELLGYQNAHDYEDLLVSEMGLSLDDRTELCQLEKEILGTSESEEENTQSTILPSETAKAPRSIVEDRDQEEILDESLAGFPLSAEPSQNGHSSVHAAQAEASGQ